MTEPSRRQRLDELVGSGRLRDYLMRYNVDEDVVDLVVDVCGRYCARRRKDPACFKRSREEMAGEFRRKG